MQGTVKAMCKNVGKKSSNDVGKKVGKKKIGK